MKTITFSNGNCSVGIKTKIPHGRPDRAISLGEIGKEKNLFFYRNSQPQIDLRTEILYRTEVLVFEDGDKEKPQCYLAREKISNDYFLVILIQRVTEIAYEKEYTAIYDKKESDGKRSFLVGVGQGHFVKIFKNTEDEKLRYLIKNEVKIGEEICVIERPPNTSDVLEKGITKVFVITDKK